MVKPFLKWAGGKTQLLKDIKDKFPYSENDEFSYIEPFVGGGAVLFWVLNNFKNLSSVVINDINTDLIISYKTIKTNSYELILSLEEIEHKYYSLSESKKKEYYYLSRELFNNRNLSDIEQSSLFIFLNRTCFNGLYRVNKGNGFNVPMGKYKKPKICDKDNLIKVSSSLKEVKILNCDFEETINFSKKETLFYLDPPYKPLTATSSFTSYTKNRFDDSEQIRLKGFCDNLNKKGFKWIMSNSDTNLCKTDSDFFDDLYKKYEIDRVVARRMINSNSSKRGKLTELLISN